jgi:predicted LPLAT superfamily acyltransferase
LKTERNHEKNLKQRLSIYGDLPTRLLLSVIKFLPSCFENVLLWIPVLFFYIIGHKQRNAVISNLKAIHKDWYYPTAWLGGYVVFWNFSRTYVDSWRVKIGHKIINWEVEGKELLQQFADSDQGILLVTLHMGNYDLAAKFFHEKLQRKFHVVRAPEKTKELAEIAKTTNTGDLYTHYNNDPMLGAKLARFLLDKELVAVQGDRLTGDVALMNIELDQGSTISLPRGPHILASLPNVIPILITLKRLGWYRYKITIKNMVLSTTDRNKSSATSWANALYEVIENNWTQWYVLEKTITKTHRNV